MDTGFFDSAACDLDAFRELTTQRLDAAEVPRAARVERNVPVYVVADLAADLEDPACRPELLAEWARVLGARSGVLVLKGAVADRGVLDASTAVFDEIIAREKAAGGQGADHFAAAGANDRVWNALQKLCEADPELFARYHAAPAIAAVAEAWLGPFFQLTAQINLVRPGGTAQSAHRDYHLGFQTAEVAARFPTHAHDLSAALTLQGAIAHCDMPVESGPTKLLPFSQLYRPGYLAYHRADFRAYFEAAHAQLPLAAGDALFFNPALFHAAGENRSADIQRMGNLLQVSSAFGRAMESIDRAGMCRRLYPVLQRLKAEGVLAPLEIDAVIASAAEGYAFPTNLDSDPPLGGLAPETQAALLARALDNGLSPAEFETALAAQTARRAP